ncbi:MAG: nitroreductase family protein [Actinobacteria bacterium]|nr:nitroreductase family protein [Actinomycetota bacterium]
MSSPMDFFDAVAGRRSIRSYSPVPPPPESLARALEAASSAPSQLNEQPWRFIIVEGEARDRLCSLVAASTRMLRDMFPLFDADSLAFAARFLSDLGGAPTAIVVTYPVAETDHQHKVNLLAAGGAILLLQVALRAEGLGSVCITCAEWVEDAIRSDLGYETERLAAIIPVGFPDGDPGEQPPREDKTVRLREWPS